MKTAILLALAALPLSACNDLTTPLPSVAGTYQYVATSSRYASHNRTGTIRIIDDDLRGARIDGTYNFRTGNGQLVTGILTGAFITPDSIWFRFVDDQVEYHEAKFAGGTGSGEIFFLTTDYRPSGTRFILSR